MGYHVLADVTMVVHFAFLAYVAAGGYLAWRWPRAIWPHLLMAGWGLATVAFNLDCPLTWAEDWARQRAGEPGPGGAFVDTYLTGVVYPAEHLGLAQALVALSVAVSWVGAAALHARSRGRHGSPGHGEREGQDDHARALRGVAGAAHERALSLTGRRPSPRAATTPAPRTTTPGMPPADTP